MLATKLHPNLTTPVVSDYTLRLGGPGCRLDKPGRCLDGPRRRLDGPGLGLDKPGLCLGKPLINPKLTF